MKFLLLIAISLTVASALTEDEILKLLEGLANQTTNVVVDNMDAYRFEEYNADNGTHFLLAVRDEEGHKECHVVEVTDHIDEIIRDSKESADVVFREFYNHIRDVHDSELHISIIAFAQQYKNNEAVKTCKDHEIFVLPFTPSFTLDDLKTGKHWHTKVITDELDDIIDTLNKTIG